MADKIPVDLGPDCVLTIDNDLTFAGVLERYYPLISKRWRQRETQMRYLADYKNLIIPALENHNNKPIQSYSQEDFDAAIERIRAQGSRRQGLEGDAYQEATIRHFRNLITCVVDTATAFHLCNNDLWGSYSSLPQEKAVDLDTELLILKKSLSVEQEVSLFQVLTRDIACSGELVGVLLCAALGLRGGEACGCTFGDIIPMAEHPSVSELWVYKSVKAGTRELQASGKTKNADRIVPIPDKVLSFLLARKNFIEGMVREHHDTVNINELPIACQGSYYDRLCDSDSLNLFAKNVFREINVAPEVIAYVESDLQNTDAEKLIQNRVIEKEPTLYLLRRNFASHLYVLLNPAEIRYILGHDLEEYHLLRADFMDEQRRWAVYKKLSVRPLFNTAQEGAIDIGTAVPTRVNTFGKRTIRVAIKPGETVRVSVQSKESFDNLKVACNNPNAMIYQYRSVKDPEEMDVRKVYVEYYAQAGGMTDENEDGFRNSVNANI